MNIKRGLTTGAGILKTAKTLGVGTGTVHRVKRSMAAVAACARSYNVSPAKISRLTA
jgi:hypothetical protein